jgi:hypothetical protein
MASHEPLLAAEAQQPAIIESQSFRIRQFSQKSVVSFVFVK